MEFNKQTAVKTVLAISGGGGDYKEEIHVVL